MNAAQLVLVLAFTGIMCLPLSKQKPAHDGVGMRRRASVSTHFWTLDRQEGVAWSLEHYYQKSLKKISYSTENSQ